MFSTACKAILCLATLTIGMGFPAFAKDELQSEPITIGTSYLLTTHDAERRINVVVPSDYAESGKDYPLVVVLDGGLRQDFFLALGMERWNQLWQRSAPAVFVGVETVDRQRELLPPTQNAKEQERYPAAGESAQFRDWLATTVLPMLRAQYRTDGRAFLIGESAAGHFVIETWTNQPELFDGYAALSPSLQWNDQALSRRFGEASSVGVRPPLFLSLADEGGATEAGILRVASNSDACFADRRHTLVHANTLHGLFPEALQYLLSTDADWLEEYGLTLDCKVRVPGNGVSEQIPTQPN